MSASAFSYHELVDEIVAGQERVFIKRPDLRAFDGYIAPNSFLRAYQQFGLKDRPFWENAILKLIPCKNYNGLVCILVGVKDWVKLVQEIKTDEIFAALSHLAAETLTRRSVGKPYAFVIYAGEVPSKVRPNTAVAFFCAEPLDEASTILQAICASAYREYFQVLEFGPIMQSRDGFVYALLDKAWTDASSRTLAPRAEAAGENYDKKLISKDCSKARIVRRNGLARVMTSMSSEKA